jgi:hypothetical protein
MTILGRLQGVDEIDDQSKQGSDDASHDGREHCPSAPTAFLQPLSHLVEQGFVDGHLFVKVVQRFRQHRLIAVDSHDIFADVGDQGLQLSRRFDQLVDDLSVAGVDGRA